MKAKLFVAALATLAFASCSETETVEMPSSAAIKFDNAFVGNAVRGEVNNGNFTKFNVFGGFDGNLTNVFNNVVVNKGEGTWTAEQIQYWQAGKSYTFQAYASETEGTPTENGVEFASYTVDPTTQEDLLASNVVKKENVVVESVGTVDFTFSHLLSMVKFTFSSTLADNVTINISELKIEALPNVGSYAVASGWTATTGTADYTFANVNGIKQSAAQASEAKIVMPQNVNGVNVSFTVTTEGALTISNTLNVTLPNVQLEKGKRYNFTAELTPENIDPSGELKPITFTANVTDWEDNTPGGNDGGVTF